MENRRITNEDFIYLLAFALALALRLTGLGEQAFSEFEANWALQAYGVAQGGAVTITGQPAYVIPTGLLFWLFSSSEALARLLPALVGSALVWLPYALRQRTGRLAGVLIAFGLAFDPGLVTVSRLAGGPMLALGFLTLALIAWWKGKPSLAGTLGALALMSGSAVLTGLVGLGLAALLWSLQYGDRKIALPTGMLKQAGLAAGVTVLAAGTLFLRYPQGLSAAFAAIPDYFRGWLPVGWFPIEDTLALLQGGGVRFRQVLVSLPVYQPLALVFGLVALTREETWAQGFSRFLALWFLTAFGLALIPPARQAADLIWALVPLWGLAGMQLTRHLRPVEAGNPVVVWGQAALMMLMLVFFWMTLSRLAMMGPVQLPADFNIIRLRDYDQTTQIYVVRLITMVLVPLAGTLSVMLVGMNWDFADAEMGAALGMAAALGFYLVSVGWRAAHVPEAAANELWYPSPGPSQSRLLRETVEELSEWSAGHKDAIEVVYLDDSAGLAWALRGLTGARYTSQFPLDELPPVVITRLGAGQDPRLIQFYRGQSFHWDERQAWGAPLPGEFNNWLAYPEDWVTPQPGAFNKWLVYRQAPTVSELLVLWARADLFPVEVDLTGEADDVLVEPEFEFDVLPAP